MTVLFEVTIQVKNLITKLLFPEPPCLRQICKVVEQVFSEHEHVSSGIVELILSVGDPTPDNPIILEIGDEIKFSDDTGQIGFMDIQTRTLFDNV